MSTIFHFRGVYFGTPSDSQIQLRLASVIVKAQLNKVTQSNIANPEETAIAAVELNAQVEAFRTTLNDLFQLIRRLKPYSVAKALGWTLEKDSPMTASALID
ncbi:MAG TPA: hypothetical protein VMF06_16890 [Candidatus Limnocylindria bacterium]|jgi:hypothetical protein|nr:hypothetical protein [Candidatus Limnocylindria bacterium]